MTTEDRIGDLPGHELMERGLADYAAGATSVGSLLVAIAAPRLAALDVLPTRGTLAEKDAELRLYALLGTEGTADTYSRYNALLRELSSFVHALERRLAAAVDPKA
jgi:hypothetical protein